MKRLYLLAIFIFFGAFPFEARSAEDRRDTSSPFGVLDFLPWDHDFNNYHYAGKKVERGIQSIKACGIKIVRLDFLWYDIEPEQGTFDFAKYDRIVDLLLKNDIKILAMLHYNPRWDNQPWNKAPNLENYMAYARSTVRHFKDRVKYWEIWNEPDVATYWVPQDGLTSYSALLKSSFAVIKQEDPTALVLHGGLGDKIPFNLKKIYEKAGRDSFDIVNIHPFTDPLNPNRLQTLEGIYRHVRKIMEANGDTSKPVWLTEIGCPGLTPPDPKQGWWHGASPNEEQQAEWVELVYKTVLTWKGVDKIFWAFFRDTDNFFKNGVDSFGLVHEDFSPKPSYKAYQRLAKEGEEERQRQSPK